MLIETKQAFLRNLSTSWLEGGNKKGPLLIFLHGYPDEPNIWSQQIDYFSKDFHILCPYARGTFASEPGSGLSRFSTHSLCLDILEIIKLADPKGMKEIRVIGHDLGGAVAWRLATYLGSKLTALVIINSLSIEQMGQRFLSRPKQWLYSWYMFPFLIPKISEKAVGTFSKELLPWAYKFGGLKQDQFPKLTPSKPFPVATLRHYRAFAKELLSSRKLASSKIKSPTLILWGKDDPFLLAPTLDELEPYAEQFTVRILEGGHWLFRESPEFINAMIDKFFNRGAQNAVHF